MHKPKVQIYYKNQKITRGQAERLLAPDIRLKNRRRIALSLLAEVQDIQFAEIEGQGHYECEECGYLVYPKIAGMVTRYKYRTPKYEDSEWPEYIELGTHRRAGYQEWVQVIEALRSRGVTYDGITSPVYVKLQPSIIDGVDNPADILHTLISKLMSKPRKRKIKKPAGDGVARPGKIECDECGGLLKMDHRGEFVCTVCSLVDADLNPIGGTSIEYTAPWGDSGKNMRGVSKANRQFEKEHDVRNWPKKHPAERKKSDSIRRLAIIVAENLDQFFGGWDHLGLHANRQLLRQLYMIKHGKMLDDSTLCRYVAEIKPLPARPKADREKQEIEESWFVHNHSPPRPKELDELVAKVKIEEIDRSLVIKSLRYNNVTVN